MVKFYYVKQKKQTECVEPSAYKTAKNGRLVKKPLKWEDTTVPRL